MGGQRGTEPSGGGGDQQQLTQHPAELLFHDHQHQCETTETSRAGGGGLRISKQLSQSPSLRKGWKLAVVAHAQNELG